MVSTYDLIAVVSHSGDVGSKSTSYGFFALHHFSSCGSDQVCHSFPLLALLALVKQNCSASFGCVQLNKLNLKKKTSFLTAWLVHVYCLTCCKSMSYHHSMPAFLWLDNLHLFFQLVAAGSAAIYKFLGDWRQGTMRFLDDSTHTLQNNNMSTNTVALLWNS